MYRGRVLCADGGCAVAPRHPFCSISLTLTLPLTDLPPSPRPAHTSHLPLSPTPVQIADIVVLANAQSSAKTVSRGGTH